MELSNTGAPAAGTRFFDDLDPEGYIRCTSRYRDTNLWEAIRKGILNEPSPLGKQDTDLWELAASGKDQELRDTCKRLLKAGETLPGLKLRFAEHLASCDACSAIQSLRQ